MAAPNTQPIYSKVADMQWITAMTAANTTISLVSGTSYLVFTADATNGGWVTEVRVKVNPANNGAATAVRLWANNGSSTGTAANSALISEISVPATTASNTAALPDFAFGLNRALNPGYRLYCTLGTAPGGSCEMTATAFSGKY